MAVPVWKFVCCFLQFASELDTIFLLLSIIFKTLLINLVPILLYSTFWV
jgi:hypothetical protein